VGCSAGDIRCPCSAAQSQSIAGLAIGCVINSCGPAGALPASSSAHAVCTCLAALPSVTSVTTTTTTSVAPPSSPTSSLPTSTTSSSSQATSSSSTSTTASSSTTSSSTGPITSSPVAPQGSPSCTNSSPCQASANAIPQCAVSRPERSSIQVYLGFYHYQTLIYHLTELLPSFRRISSWLPTNRLSVSMFKLSILSYSVGCLELCA